MRSDADFAWIIQPPISFCQATNKQLRITWHEIQPKTQWFSPFHTTRSDLYIDGSEIQICQAAEIYESQPQKLGDYHPFLSIHAGFLNHQLCDSDPVIDYMISIVFLTTRGPLRPFRQESGGKKSIQKKLLVSREFLSGKKNSQILAAPIPSAKLAVLRSKSSEV